MKLLKRIAKNALSLSNPKNHRALDALLFFYLQEYHLMALRFTRATFLVLCSFALAACSSTYQGPVSDHFDGKVFKNPGPPKSSSVAGYLWLRLTSSQGTWPDAVSMPAEPPPPARVEDGSARVTYIGHATVLIQIAGLNILTDPVWAQRASPLSFAGPKRVTQPSMALQALPRLMWC